MFTILSFRLLHYKIICQLVNCHFIAAKTTFDNTSERTLVNASTKLL